MVLYAYVLSLHPARSSGFVIPSPSGGPAAAVPVSLTGSAAAGSAGGGWDDCQGGGFVRGLWVLFPGGARPGPPIFPLARALGVHHPGVPDCNVFFFFTSFSVSSFSYRFVVCMLRRC